MPTAIVAPARWRRTSPLPNRVITSDHRRVPSRPPAADYDPIAWFYQKHWCRHYHPGLLAVLHRFLFPHLPAPAQLLDLGCGTGTLAQALVAHGFRVTGLDRSEQMLRYARQ